MKGEHTRRGRVVLPVLVCAIAAGLLLDLYFSNQLPQVTRTAIQLKRLPAAFEGLTVAHLSDMHATDYGQRNAVTIRLLTESAPDLIAITGDFIDNNGDLDWADRTIEQLAAIAPVYYVTGNHEWGADWAAKREGRERLTPKLKALFDKHEGAFWLDFGYTLLERGGEKLALVGLCDPNGPLDKLDDSDLLESIRGEHGQDICTVALAHRYDRLPAYAALGLDLVMTGHAHGGIVRPPFTDGLIGPDRGFFPTNTSGANRRDGTVMYTSRGLGASYVPRMLNRPEIALLTLGRGVAAGAIAQ